MTMKCRNIHIFIFQPRGNHLERYFGDGPIVVAELSDMVSESARMSIEKHRQGAQLQRRLPDSAVMSFFSPFVTFTELFLAQTGRSCVSGSISKHRPDMHSIHIPAKKYIYIYGVTVHPPKTYLLDKFMFGDDNLSAN